MSTCPSALVALVIVALRLQLPSRRTQHRIDYVGAGLLAGGVASLILVTTWGGNQYAWGSKPIVGLAVAGVLLLLAFVWQESRAREPIIPLDLFRSRVFNVASAMGFTIGMAMFGAIVFIPLFLQLVYGASPTASGLRMLPLMIGLLVAAVASGRVISRIGRYRPFPIVGTAVLVGGMFLLSRLGVGTAPRLASVYMLVVGVGIGLVMQVLVLVVQNDAKPENMGVATSTATFFRSVGGSFGVAIFGAIFASALTSRLEKLPSSVTDRIGSGTHLNPEQVRNLPPRVHEFFLQAFSDSLHGVFLWGMAIAVIPFGLSWLLKEVPLRTTVGRPVDAPVEPTV